MASVEKTMASMGAGLEHSSPFSVTYHLMQQSRQLKMRMTPLKVTRTAEVPEVLLSEQEVSGKEPVLLAPLEMEPMAQ